MDYPYDHDGLPAIEALPLTELLESQDWRLKNAARRVDESLHEESYAAHGTSPIPRD